MSTFHPFPRLPFELRTQVWKATVEPCTVDVHFEYWDSNVECLGEQTAFQFRQVPVSSTPIPATLRTCREARIAALYQRCFAELSQELPDEGRYVWLNLDIHIVSIGNTPFTCYFPVASSIQRLKFERKYQDEGFYLFESHEIRKFPYLKEIYAGCV